MLQKLYPVFRMMAGGSTKVKFRAYIDGMKSKGIAANVSVTRATLEVLTPGVMVQDASLFPPVHNWRTLIVINPSGSFVVWKDVPLGRRSYYIFGAKVHLDTHMPDTVSFRVNMGFSLVRDDGSCVNEIQLPLEVGATAWAKLWWLAGYFGKKDQIAAPNLTRLHIHHSSPSSRA